MAESKQLTTQSVTAAMVVPYGEEEQYVNSQCKLCSAPADIRVAAESQYDHRASYRSIERYLAEKDFEISYHAVKNHMIQHYIPGKNVELMKWYANDVARWVNFSKDKETAMKTRIAVLEREMHMLSAQSEDLPLGDRRKNAEQVRKLAETLLSYETRLNDLQNQMGPVQHIFHHLNIIVKDELKRVKSVEAKTLMVDVIDRLQNEVGTMVLDSAD